MISSHLLYCWISPRFHQYNHCPLVSFRWHQMEQRASLVIHWPIKQHADILRLQSFFSILRNFVFFCQGMFYFTVYSNRAQKGL